MTSKHADIRARARAALERSDVVMRDGHFDYGNGYHGRLYVNAHALFLQPSMIWRAAQDLIDILPYDLTSKVEVVAGPATGGALLAHTLAGLFDGRRSLSHPPCQFAPFNVDQDMGLTLRPFYAQHLAGKHVLIADDVRNTGKTFERCASLVRDAGGTVLATVEIYDRLEAIVETGVPNFALVDYGAPENVLATACPQCAAGVPLTRF